MSESQSVRSQIEASHEATRQQIELTASRIASRLQEVIAAAGEQGAIVPAFIGDMSMRSATL